MRIYKKADVQAMASMFAKGLFTASTPTLYVRKLRRQSWVAYKDSYLPANISIWTEDTLVDWFYDAFYDAWGRLEAACHVD